MEIDLRNGCCPPTFFDSKFTEIEWLCHQGDSNGDSTT